MRMQGVQKRHPAEPLMRENREVYLLDVLGIFSNRERRWWVFSTLCRGGQENGRP